MFPRFEFLGEEFFTYPMLLGLIWGIGYHFSLNLIRSKNLKIPYFNFFYIWVFTSAWLGAKFFFLFLLDESTIKQAAITSNFWLGGGFVFYGGLIFGGLALVSYAKYFKLKLSQFEFVIPVLCIGHAVGRLGCFLAGCCFGDHCELPWSIHQHGVDRHPVQLYEATALFILFFWLYKRFKKNEGIIKQYIISYALIRFVTEFFRGDEIRGVYLGLFSTSQLISIVILVLFGSVFLYKRDGESRNS